MQSSGRIALLAINTAAALAGVAVLFVLVQQSLVENHPPVRQTTARIRVPVAAVQAERVASAQPVSPETLPSPTTDPGWRSSITKGADGGGAWSTEVKPETAATHSRLDLLRSLRLPWSSAGKAAPQTPRTWTLKARLAELSPTVTPRLVAKFEAAKAPWPPTEIALVAIKDERALELHARAGGGAWQFIHRYRVLAASGGLGPKLRQGDKQVPEGLYGISFLNPNSAYHVSMAVSYPNAFDRQMATRDGRKELGGDIMIHGKNLSAGCLAMGDEAAEELFVLSAQAGLPNVHLIIAPTDFRQKGLPLIEPGKPAWLPGLYAEIATRMAELKVPKPAAAGLFALFTR